LFLRNYLSHCTKSRLPDVGSPFEGVGGSVQDATDFVLTNFTESNRLWVRLQNQGASKDRKKREKERQDLRILVGTNLVRLSQLEGLDLHEYKSSVLPRILEQVVLCKDTIAQSYLMDCTIQVFPDEFHLATLEPFLQTCTNLKDKVNVRAILESMMDRLAYYAASNSGQIPAEVKAFKMFNDCITTLIENRTNLTLTETLRLQTSLTNFALKCYPARLDYVAHCLNTSVTLIQKSDFQESLAAEGENSGNKSLNDTTAQIEQLLSVLELPQYASLMSYLPWGNWKEVAASLLKSVVASNSPLCELEQAEQLFAVIVPLLKDRDGATREADEEGREAPVDDHFKQEQLLVAKVVHLMQNDDTDTLLRIFVAARTKFINGGSSRIQFTLVPLVFAALSLTNRVLAREKAAVAEQDTAPQFSTRKVFQFIIEIVTAMATSHPEISMNLFLQAAQAADQCSFSAIAYEFMKDYEALITKTAQVREGEEVEAPVQRYADCDRVLECMQRSLKIASVCNPDIFVEILDRYIFYFENHNPLIHVRYISGLIALINEQMGTDGEGATQEGGSQQMGSAVKAHYRNTL
ncbi:VPS35B, partial [Symbiodinium microadriaticum]